MTSFGGDLEVDGTVTARQATQAGQAVVLGEDMKIPTSFYDASSSGTIRFTDFNEFANSDVLGIVALKLTASFQGMQDFNLTFCGCRATDFKSYGAGVVYSGTTFEGTVYELNHSQNSLTPLFFTKAGSLTSDLFLGPPFSDVEIYVVEF